MQEQLTQTPTGEAAQAALARFMRECEPDRAALAEELEPLFRDLFAEALKAVETCLPDFMEPGSADARLHHSARNRILNVGNAKIRELPSILKNYAVSQVFEREVVVRQRVNTPVALPESALGATR